MKQPQIIQKTSKGGRVRVGNVSAKKPDAVNTSKPRVGSGNVSVKLPDFS
jgi:hypothetical protein